MAIKNSKENEQLRQRNKDLFHGAALYWNKLANERLFEISKQLLGISFIILPLTGSVVLSDKIISTANFHLLLLGWITLFASIISGFFNLWIEAKYFNYLSNDSSAREEIWSDSSRPVEQMNKETNKLGPTKQASSFYPLIIQGAALFLGISLIMIVMVSMLSQNKSVNHFDTGRANVNRFYFHGNSIR
jgi:hypothetical protein